MKKIPLIALLNIILLSLLALHDFGSGLAQYVDWWSPVLVVPGYLDDTLPPYLVVDNEKKIHAFVSQWVGAGNDRRLAIYYNQWTRDGGWTKPVDVLTARSGQAEIAGAFLDSLGKMHVVFRGGDSRSSAFYYANVPIASADFAPAWTSPGIIGSRPSQPVSGDIVGDDQGNLAIIYSGNVVGVGVYALFSEDAGESWTDPAPIYLTDEPENIPAYLHLAVSPSGQVHAIWSEVDNKGNAVKLYYARFDFPSHLWTEPVILARDDFGDVGAGIFGPAYPQIIANEDSVLVMYNANGGYATVGRPALWVRRSQDGGQSWSEAYRPFPRHVGMSGDHDLVLDSSGNIHALFLQRIERYIDNEYAPIGGLWHSELLGSEWSIPERYSMAGKIAGYDVHAVVSQGNTLLATFREDPGLGPKGVFYSYRNIDSPGLPVAAYPTLTAIPVITPEETPAVASAESPTPVGGVNEPPNPRSGNQTSASFPTIVGLVPVVLLVLVVAATKFKSRQPSR